MTIRYSSQIWIVHVSQQQWGHLLFSICHPFCSKYCPIIFGHFQYLPLLCITLTCMSSFIQAITSPGKLLPSYCSTTHWPILKCWVVMFVGVSSSLGESRVGTIQFSDGHKVKYTIRCICHHHFILPFRNNTMLLLCSGHRYNTFPKSV